MADTPNPTNVIQLNQKSEPEAATPPAFPHTRIRGNGAPQVLSTSNNLKVLLGHIGLKGCLNEMTYELEILQNGKPCYSPNAARSLILDAMAIYDMPRQALDDHLTTISETELYHPVKDWLDSGEWDGQKRLEKVLACLNADNKEATEIILTRWLVGCVASLYEPRFKSKLVPVLAGGQSNMKTAFIERLARVVPRAFLEGATLNPDNKDSVLATIRSWITELGELERTTKSKYANIGSLKSFITKEIDVVRPHYAKGDMWKPRKTHLFATVNGHDFLGDDTGNSRFGVIECNNPIDMDKLNDILGWHYDGTGTLEQPYPEKLKQFWLEIKELYLNRHGWMLTPKEVKLISPITDKYNDKGAWYQVLFDKFVDVPESKYRKPEWMTSTAVCEHLGEPREKSRPLGRALTMLADEGLIERKTSKGTNKYKLMVIAERED